MLMYPSRNENPDSLLILSLQFKNFEQAKNESLDIKPLNFITLEATFIQPFLTVNT